MREIPLATKVFTAASFTATVALAMYVLWLRDAHPTWVLALASVLVLAGLSTIGGLLDGRPGAAGLEALRLAATALFGVGMAGDAAYRVVGPLVFALAASGLLAIGLTGRRFERART